MGVIDRIRFGTVGSPAAVTGPEAAQYGKMSVIDRLTWDNRLGYVLNKSPVTAKPWDALTAFDARNYPAWYRALVILSTGTFGMPIDVKRVEESDGKIKLLPGNDHEAYWPICIQANSEETASAARSRMVWIAAQYGAARAGIVRSQGKPIQIVPFQPYQCWPERIDGEKFYMVDPYGMKGVDNSSLRKLKPEDVIEISLPCDDGYYPDEPYYIGRMALHEGVSGARVRSARATNSGRPKMALTTDQILNEARVKRLREEFPVIHSGLDDQVVPAILDGGLKPMPIPYQPEYQAENVLYGIGLRAVSQLSGVPSVLLGDVEGMSYQSLEQFIRLFYTTGLGVWLDQLEDQYKAKLLKPDERRWNRTQIKFDRNVERFADTKTMGDLIRVLGAGAPVAEINEIRAKIGMSALDDPIANQLHLPKNMGEGGQNNLPTNPSENNRGRPPSASKSGIKVAGMVFKRYCRRIGQEACRKSSNAKAFMEYADNLPNAYKKQVFGEFKVLAEDTECWKGKDSNKIAEAFLSECKEWLLDIAGQVHAKDLSALVHKKAIEFEAEFPAKFIHKQFEVIS